ncbi:MAG: AI-2E family transporter [Clostridia bacterium]|nr:AI-2E family transporter [Clostridia bacterium]
MIAKKAFPGLSLPWQWAVGTGAVIALAVFWHPLARLLGQVGVAVLLAGGALPICRRIEKRLPRPWAAALSILAIIFSIIGLIGFMVPHIIAQVSLLIGQLPRLLQILQDLWARLSAREWLDPLNMDMLDPGKWMKKAAEWLGNNLPAVISSVGAGVDFISRAFLSPILGYYFLRDREVFGYRLSLWIPSRHRKRMLTALQEMRREAGGYIRGQLMVALAVAVLTAAGLMALGIPAWLVLGLVMGICELIPFVGPLIGGIPIALFSLSQGISATLWALGIVIAVQQIEGYFLAPRLMGGATGLHPVYILLLLSAGGLIGGLLGMVLALPLFVCLRGASRVLYATRAPDKM